MTRRGAFSDFDWSRTSRWCLLGAIVMVIWLLVPVARCSFTAFRSTPLNESDAPVDPNAADKARLEEGRGFLDRWTRQVGVCYDAKPLFGQEAWKSDVMLAFAATSALAFVFARMTKRRSFQ